MKGYEKPLIQDLKEGRLRATYANYDKNYNIPSSTTTYKDSLKTSGFNIGIATGQNTTSSNIG